ncbi:esterase/lipase family protein [Streptomyces litchfieldiae]|uniref:Alpha/beta fold hydrolase n=1 Tax=Streptomyces litchfieldiae TaxID=3075543 RepID=A0ABU2MV24_9ACTN|nr:alpha/beta fold hydrolase [Streptomyces sp. DSM 44938]MDT0345501.1 alpha/beta fold hydrolase [Streptomyces sp. DSM 44938]
MLSRKQALKRTRPLFAGAVLAVPLALAPGAAATAAQQHGGWNDADCVPAPEHPRPVVLVHGTFGNAVDNWLGLAPYLADRGYCVHSFDYGELPGVPFFHGLGPMEESAAELADHVDEVLAASGAAEVDVVGHSQGGVLPRHYLKHDPEGAAKVNALVGIAPNTNGTTLSGLTRLLDLFPGAGDLLDEHTPALTQQVVGSEFMTELNADGYTVPGVTYTVIATRYDEVVTPYRSQFINEPGVTNVLLQDLCPLDISEHLAIGLVDRLAFHEVANALDPANAEPTTCRHFL